MHCFTEQLLKSIKLKYHGQTKKEGIDVITNNSKKMA